jgi:hypothetical protein
MLHLNSGNKNMLKELLEIGNTELERFINQFEKVDFMPDGSDSVEFVTYIGKPSGLLCPGADSGVKDEYGEYESAFSISKLLEVHLENLKKLMNKYPNKKCYVRISPEIGYNPDNCEISVYTRFIFREDA